MQLKDENIALLKVQKEQEKALEIMAKETELDKKIEEISAEVK